MGQEIWASVDRYILECLVPTDPALQAALEENERAGLPAFDVSPSQGKFLYLLCRLHRTKRILEIGTLGGYSTIWLGRSLPSDGLLVTLESEEKHIRIAQENVKRAELPCSVEFRLGPALESLERLQAEGVEPFDLIFIDADKPNNPGYLEWSIRLARAGSVIIGDNVIRDGAIINPNDPDPRVRGVREFFRLMSSDPRISATALQTVGSKGYDGFSIALVNHS